jgi:hypothetical protein
MKNALALVTSLVVALAACKASDSKVDHAAAKTATAGVASTDSAATTAPRPASITDADIAAADKMIATVTAVSDAMAMASTCADAQHTLEASATSFVENADAMKLAVQHSKADPAADAWFEAHYKERMKAASMPMMLKAASCKADPDFKAALARLPMFKKKTAS